MAGSMLATAFVAAATLDDAETGGGERLRVQRPRHAGGELARGQGFSYDDIRLHALDAEITTHQHHRNRAAEDTHFPDERGAGKTGPALVGKHGIEALRLCPEGRERSGTGRKADWSIAKLLERFGGKAHERFLVVNHQHPLSRPALQRSL